MSPEYKTTQRGYKLPLPRLRSPGDKTGKSTKKGDVPVELLDVISSKRSIYLSIPKTYPDNGLPYIIAKELIGVQVGNKQAFPIVVDAETVKPPRFNLDRIFESYIDNDVVEANGLQRVFIVSEPDLTSKTRTSVLMAEINEHVEDIVIVVGRPQTNLEFYADFITGANLDVYDVINVSFSQMTHFISRNFEMSVGEAEVIALRLKNTFDKFNVNTHPTYFAGVPRETLSALLQANRRAEIIQLSVDGFLSFAVLGDKSENKLSRTTRSSFLKRIVRAIKVEKILLKFEDVVVMARGFIDEMDFDVKPVDFVNSFFAFNILHNDGEKVVFSLPFVQDYLLADDLSQNPDSAEKYFVFGAKEFDYDCFDLYAEIGPSDILVDLIIKHIENVIAGQGDITDESHVLLSGQIIPAIMSKPDRVDVIKNSLKRMAYDVQSHKNGTNDKQRILDLSDKARELAAEKSLIDGDDKFHTEDELEDQMKAWVLGVLMLGSGHERLSAIIKRQLARLLINLASVILHSWTMKYAEIDFVGIKKELKNSSLAESLAALPENTRSRAQIESLIDDLVDVLEFEILCIPLRSIMYQLTEQVRDKLLALSISKATPVTQMGSILHSIWLADVDSTRGGDLLRSSIRDLPPAPFLRALLSSHMITRVFWSHSNERDRAFLLDMASEIVGSGAAHSEKGKLIRELKEQILGENDPKNAFDR